VQASRILARRLPVGCLLIVALVAHARADDAQQRPTDTARQGVGRLVGGAQDLAMVALAMIGAEYRFGGSIPEHGFDCSGLVQFVFQQATGVSLPRTSLAMSKVGQAVPSGELRVGDLVFFNTRRFPFSHVGIYLGDSRFIHAPSAGGIVEIGRMSESYWQRKFDGARRLVGILPDLIAPAEAGGTFEAQAPADRLPSRADAP
jgi:cell wall-associated NlpC family hydrolase